MKNIHQSNDPWYGRAIIVDDVTHYEFLVICFKKFNLKIKSLKN